MPASADLEENCWHQFINIINEAAMKNDRTVKRVKNNISA